MIHLYHGDGKGKTTAAFGLALRAVAAGWGVCVVQFLKDGSSGEARMLASLPRTEILACDPTVTFVSRMSSEQRGRTRVTHDANLRRAREAADRGDVRLIVLDEVCAALSHGLVDEAAVRDLVGLAAGSEDGLELVCTGRDPAGWLLDAADYVTHMQASRHPYDRGVGAREGVEF